MILRLSHPATRGAPVKTAAIQGSTPWTLLDAKWAAGHDAHLAQICVYRDPSERTEGRIRGTARIDDVSLRRTSPERREP